MSSYTHQVDRPKMVKVHFCLIMCVNPVALDAMDDLLSPALA